jgi:hypothetical protein
MTEVASSGILAQVRLTLTALAAENLQRSILSENITHPRKIKSGVCYVS